MSQGNNDMRTTDCSRPKAFQNLRFQNKRRNPQRRQEEKAVTETKRKIHGLWGPESKIANNQEYM